MLTCMRPGVEEAMSVCGRLREEAAWCGNRRVQLAVMQADARGGPRRGVYNHCVVGTCSEQGVQGQHQQWGVPETHDEKARLLPWAGEGKGEEEQKTKCRNGILNGFLCKNHPVSIGPVWGGRAQEHCCTGGKGGVVMRQMYTFTAHHIQARVTKSPLHKTPALSTCI